MRAAAELLPQVYRKLARDAAGQEALMLALWPTVVGPRLAAHARPVRLFGATLIVETEAQNWRKELAQLTGPIVRHLNAAAGGQIVQDVEFRVAVRRAPLPPGRALSATGSADRSAGGQEADEAAAIADPHLRRIYRQSQRRSQSQ